MTARDYEALGLVAGLEIHQQLDTETKLFCGCPTRLREPGEASHTLTRYLHPTPSELGEIDEAALEESRVGRAFEYLAYDTTCLVEEDDEPPGRLNEEALEVSLVIAELLGMDVVDQVHVMRKIVIDGSNTTGFQRSALVARDGVIETSEGPVSVVDLMLEEESAQRVAETDAGVRYSLDRLGIPLVEIGTGPDIGSPAQAREAAEVIGMLLRSTGRVKRGLGTIRQDVNISIEAGARVELKGVQQLEAIGEIVEREADRQVRLVELAGELAGRGASVGEPVDVSGVFEGTDSGVLRGVLADGGVVVAVGLRGFDGVVGAELQPDRRLGSEFADHARRHGAGGVFHTDELPAYGITTEEVAGLREVVGAGAEDAVVFVAGDAGVAAEAIRAVARRAETAIAGVPEETRGVNEDGTSRYLRPLPGAARMYPETDVPPVVPDPAEIERPELLDEKVERYGREYGLDRGLAEQVAYGEYVGVFEDAVGAGVEPTLAATTLTGTLTELRRDGVPVEALGPARLREVFDLVADGEIAREGIPELVERVARDPGVSAADAAAGSGLGRADEAAVRETVVGVVEAHEDQVTAEGMDAFSALMGECMAELRGKADGELVSRVLREEIQGRVD